jgi:hypothetical protein
MLMLLVATLLVISAVQPVMAAQGPVRALAAWQPLNQTVGDLRLQRTKTVVENGIAVAIAALNVAGKGVERSKLTDNQKAELKAQVEANITWFEAKKRDVQSSRDVASALQNAKQASDRWNEVYPDLKKEAGLMACDNFEAKLSKARDVTAIVSSKIDSLKAQGKDTGSLENALAAYNGHIDGASRYGANARSEFDAIGSSRQDGHFAAGIKQLGLAENEMKGAYSDLKNIYRLLFGNSVKIT